MSAVPNHNHNEEDRLMAVEHKLVRLEEWRTNHQNAFNTQVSEVRGLRDDVQGLKLDIRSMTAKMGVAMIVLIPVLNVLLTWVASTITGK